MPCGEAERHLGHARSPTADQQLEKDLEAAWAQVVEVDPVAAHGEEPGHGVGDAAQVAGEDDLRGSGGGARHSDAQRSCEPGLLAVRAVAARDDDVGVLQLTLGEQVEDQLGRMLQVAVHHDDPRCAGCPQTVDDRAPESSVPLTRGAVEQPDVQRRRAGSTLDGVRRRVVAVVDEEDLCSAARQRLLEAGQQHRHVAGLVAGRDDDRDRRVRRREGLPERHDDAVDMAVRHVLPQSRSRAADRRTDSAILQPCDLQGQRTNGAPSRRSAAGTAPFDAIGRRSVPAWLTRAIAGCPAGTRHLRRSHTRRRAGPP